MTACILTGFAKKKKFVGNVYACNGSDLPATQDFGTVQYQGPSETALTVPATTVTYTIIGKTQCGDDIRRITTKTYSSRSVANQYKDTSTLSINGVNEENGSYAGSNAWIPAGSITYGYGSSLALAQSNANYNWWLINPQNGWSNGVSRGTKPAFVDTTLVQYSGAYNSWVHQSTVQMTFYYLDVHEVWTYDLV